MVGLGARALSPCGRTHGGSGFHETRCTTDAHHSDCNSSECVAEVGDTGSVRGRSLEVDCRTRCSPVCSNRGHGISARGMMEGYLQVTYRNGQPFAAYYCPPGVRRRKSARCEEMKPGLVIDFAADGSALGIEILEP